MALRVFVVLIVLALLAMVPHLPRWRRFGWFGNWVRHLGDIGGSGRVVVALLLPVVACLLVAIAVSQRPLLGVLWVVFAVVVLVYAFGPRELDEDISAVIDAPDPAARHDAAQRLRPRADDPPLQTHAPDWVEAAVQSSLHRRFGVLFWFLLAGPTGALLYRLAHQLAEGDAAAALDAEARSGARRFLELLDWLPATLMVVAMALVSDYDAVMQAWQAWRAAPERAARPLESGFLGAVARAGVDADVQAGDGYAVDVSDPLLELSDTRRLLWRVLVVWLAVAALIAIAGWLV